MNTANTLESRLERLESIDEIRQLAAKYALAADMRDLDALVGLYTEDVAVEATENGRPALRAYFDRVLRQFDATAHLIGNHIIEFDDPSHAQGMVYCYAQHEIGQHFIVAQLLYHDSYERRDRRWLFNRRRRPLLWYACDANEKPTGPHKVRFPGKEPVAGAMHGYSPAWEAFRSGASSANGSTVEPAQIDRFLKEIRRDAATSGVETTPTVEQPG